MAWNEPGRADTILKLGSRLLDDAKVYAKAEIDVAKQTGLVYVRAAKRGVILGIVALLLALSALPVLIAALGMTFAPWIGTAAGLAAAAVLVILLAGLLAYLAAKSLGRIADATGDKAP